MNQNEIFVFLKKNSDRRFTIDELQFFLGDKCNRTCLYKKLQRLVRYCNDIHLTSFGDKLNKNYYWFEKYEKDK